MSTVNYVTQPARQIPVYGEYDVVVLGGGPAGLMAAASAARGGASVLLIERYGFLGGMGTAAGVSKFCGLYANVYGEQQRVVHGMADDLLDRLRILGGLCEPTLQQDKIYVQNYDISAFKCAADSLLCDSGAKVLFHTLATGIVRGQDGAIDALLLATKSGPLAVRGRIFIGCSGDADIPNWAGLEVEKGDAQGNLSMPTLMFRVGNVDGKRAHEARKSIPQIMLEAEASGDFRFPRRNAMISPQRHDYEWRVDVTQLRDPDGSAADGTNVESMSAAELEGRRQVVEYLDFLRARVPGFEHAYVMDIAPQLGVRETRRVVTEYMLTREDVLGCVDFPDSIGVNGWPLEIHKTSDVQWEWPPILDSRGYNHLPLRMLLPRQSPDTAHNVLVAGRCAGMTHEAHAAARVSGTCFVMGEAAGTAAALALRAGVPPAQVSVAQLQNQLQRQGVFLGETQEQPQQAA